MNRIVMIGIMLLSFSGIAGDKNNEDHKIKKSLQEVGEKNHPAPLSVFDIIPLNSPVKESVARFLLKVPSGFDIDKISYKARNAGRIFEKVKAHQMINLVEGPQGKELRISVSKMPPGFYQLFVKVKDRKNKDHEYKNKYKDHVMFVVDNSLQVPAPNPKTNDKTVAGVDSDGDGIRDDIQRWINEEFNSQPKVKAAMRQVAMGRQLDLLSVGNKEQSIIAGKKMLDADGCLYFVVGLDAGAKIARELKSKLLNTKDRLYAEIKANANFSGQAYESPSTPEEDKSLCAFNPDSL